MAGLRTELRENDAKEASFRPSPNELSAIERLQRSGVTGIDLLDRMVEQGEDWLVVTMRRLDHFERTGLAPKDYSTWCEHALAARTTGSTTSAWRRAAVPRPALRVSPRRPPAAVTTATAAAVQGTRPTAPVPASGGGWNGSNQGAGYSGGQGDDGKDGRNIFRIFSN